jgi:hypothetical protein
VPLYHHIFRLIYSMFTFRISFKVFVDVSLGAGAASNFDSDSNKTYPTNLPSIKQCGAGLMFSCSDSWVQIGLVGKNLGMTREY